MKLLKSTISIYINHILAVLASLFLGLAFYETAQNKPLLFSAITLLIYIITLYMAAWRIGRRDGRNIPGFKPDIKMPLKVSVITAIVPMILLVFRLVLPDVLTIGYDFANGAQDFLVGGCLVVGTPDLIYRVWFFHLAAFVPCGNIFAYIAELFVLPVIIFAGYYVGVSKFSISEWLYSKIVFTDKRNK